MVSEQRYEKAMAAYKEFGGEVFLKVHLGLLRFLEGDCTAANVLAYVLNRLRVMDGYHATRQQLINDGLYIKVPSEEILNDMGISEYLKHRAIKTLEEKGLLLTKHGRGNGLLIKVRWKGLEKAAKSESKNSRIQKFKNLKPSDSESKNLRFPTIDKEEKKEGSATAATPPCVPSPPFQPSFNGDPTLVKNGCRPPEDKKKKAPRRFSEQIDQKYLTAANLLRSTVRSAGEQYLATDINSAKSLRTLCEHDGQKDFRKVLRLFCENYRQAADMGLPTGITSGAEFRKRFTWIKGKLVKAGLIDRPTTPQEEDPTDRIRSKVKQRYDAEGRLVGESMNARDLYN